MIRIRYDYLNSSGKPAWDDALTDADSAPEALETLVKVVPKFALGRLTCIELFALDVQPYVTMEKPIRDCNEIVTAFIATHRAQTDAPVAL